MNGFNGSINYLGITWEWHYFNRFPFIEKYSDWEHDRQNWPMHRWCCPLKHVDFLVPGGCSPPQLWHSLEQEKVQETSLLGNKTRISIYKMSFDQSNKESVRTLKLVFSSPLSGVTRYRLNIQVYYQLLQFPFKKNTETPLTWPPMDWRSSAHPWLTVALAQRPRLRASRGEDGSNGTHAHPTRQW